MTKLAAFSLRNTPCREAVLRAFEDAGYDCIDNLPVSLIEQLVETMEGERCQHIAIAIDARRGASISELPALLKKLRHQHQVDVLFLNADTNTLVQRFSETRRRHPLSHPNQSSTLIDAIEKNNPAYESVTKVIKTTLVERESTKKLVKIIK